MNGNHQGEPEEAVKLLGWIEPSNVRGVSKPPCYLKILLLPLYLRGRYGSP